MSAEPVCNGTGDGGGRVGESIFSSRSIGVDEIHEDERIKVVSYGSPHKMGFVSRSFVTLAKSHKLGL